MKTNKAILDEFGNILTQDIHDFNSKLLKEVFEKVDFVGKYQNICEKYNDFNNGLRGNKHNLYNAILNKLGYNMKYFRSETFYRLEENIEDIMFGIQLVLKDGLVETMFYGEKNGKHFLPGGRADFMCVDLEPNFDREQYNLPKYTSEEDLEDILKEIFGIYEDLKTEFIKQNVE